MPQNIPVGYGQATFGFTHEAAPRPLAITLGVSLVNAGADYVTVANAIFRRFENTVLEDLDNGLTLNHVDLFIGAGTAPSGSVRSSFGAKPGGRAMVSMPLNTCVLVEKQTGFLGRSNRGRMFVPSSGPASDVSEIGNLSDSLRTSLQGSWTDFYNELSDGGEPGDPLPGAAILPVLIHQDVVAAPTPISGFRVVQKVGTRPTRIR